MDKPRVDLKKLNVTEFRQNLSDVGLSQEGAAKDDLITRLLENYDVEAEATKVKKLTSDESTTTILTELLNLQISESKKKDKEATDQENVLIKLITTTTETKKGNIKESRQ